jgi:hypothetical protein
MNQSDWPCGRVTLRQSEAMESAPSASVSPAPEPHGPVSAPVRVDAGSRSGSSPGRSAGPTPDAAAVPSRSDNDELMAEIVHLRREITQLHNSIGALTAAITSLAARPPDACPQPAAELPPAIAPATLLALRSGERLNGEVQRRLRLGSDADSDTELDLLIDRLHDLSDAGS